MKNRFIVNIVSLFFIFFYMSGDRIVIVFINLRRYKGLDDILRKNVRGNWKLIDFIYR